MAFVSYDSYKNRIEKLAKFKNFVVKYKFLIMGVLAVILGGASALMATKGMITTDITLSADTYTYGDSYTPTVGTAFLSDVGYEYSVQGSDEWTEQKPVKVGKYSVRAVSNKLVGKGYGTPVDFEILPKKVEFAFGDETSLTYGNKPQRYNVDGLVLSDKIDVNGAAFAYDYHDEADDVSDWTVDVTVAAGSVKIVDKNGNDSSDCYIYETAEKTFALTKRNLPVRLQSSNDIYRGAEISYAGELMSPNLAEGDSIAFETEITQNGSPAKLLDAGTYGVSIKENSIKITKGGSDVTKRYDIGAPQNGTFTVRQRPLTITTQDGNKVYDGKALSNEGATPDNLVTGHKLSPIGVAPSITDVGKIPNAQTFDILDANGVEVSHNYDYQNNYKYGYLTVTPRPLTITTEGGEWEYDGKAHPVTEYNAIGLADGQVLVVNSYASQTAINVDDSGKNSVEYSIAWQSGGDVSRDNYAVTENYGDIKITPIPLRVFTDNGSKPYDGTPLSVETYTVFYAGTHLSGTGSMSLDLTPVGSIPRIINVGTKENAINFAVPNNNYYVKETVNGTLQITQAEITITLDNASCDYGDTLPAPNITISGSGIVGGELFGGDTLTPAFKYLKDGATPASYEAGKTYDISLDTLNSKFTYGNDEPVTQPNYKITSNTSTLTVGTRAITVYLNDTTVTYGNALIYNLGNEEVEGVVGGQTVQVNSSQVVFDISSTMPDAGTYPGKISCPTTAIKISNGTTDVTSNYEVTVEVSTLYISQRPITVHAKDILGVIYGVTPQYEVEVGNYKSITEDGLASGETLTVNNVSYLTTNGIPVDPSDNPDVGTYKIKPSSVSITKSNGDDSLKNYDITPADDGVFTIVERPITIQSATDLDLIYDGTAQYRTGKEVTSELNVLGGHRIEVTKYTTVTDVSEGTVTNELKYAIKDSFNNVVTTNYAITDNFGTLKVNPRPITIQLNNYTAVYGESYAYATGAGNYENTPDLVNGETLEVTKVAYEFGFVVTPNVRDTAYWVRGDTFKVTKANGVPSTGNYKVEWVDGSLEITKRHIEVTLKSDSAIYGNGYAYATAYAGNYAKTKLLDLETGNALVSGEQLKITAVTYEYGTEQYPEVKKDGGGYWIRQDGYEITKGSVDGKGNYEIEWVDGTLTITQRGIYVTLNDIATVKYGEEVKYPEGYKSEMGVLDIHTVTVGATADDMSFNPAGADATFAYPDAGSYTFTCDESYISISDASGKDAKHNYTVNVVKGSLEIEKREITVKPTSYSVVYGENFNYSTNANPNYEKITEGSLANFGGETETLYIFVDLLEFDGFVKKDVGKYTFTPNRYTVTKVDGTTDSSNNYTVVFEEGTLTITPKVIPVELEEVPFVYGEDGHTKKSYAELYAEKITEVTITPAETLKLTFSFTKNGTPADPKDAGDYGVKITNGKTNNYEVVSNDTGKLTISKRQIHPVPYFKTAEYGTTEFIYPSVAANGSTNYDEQFKEFYYNLPAYNEKIEISVSYDISEEVPSVGFYNAICDGVKVYVDGVTGGAIVASGSDGLFETKNYTIFIDEDNFAEKLEITHRKIKVTLNSMPNAVYGDEIAYNAGGETADNLVNGHELTVDPNGIEFDPIGNAIYPNAGRYTITSNENFIKILSGGDEVTTNYEVTEVINGTLTINARKITLTLEDMGEIVYGTKTPVPTITGTVNGDTVTNDEFIYSNITTPTMSSYFESDWLNGGENRYLTVGTYRVSINLKNVRVYTFEYANGAPADTKNYDVQAVQYANLIVKQRPITVELQPFTRVYGQNNSDTLIWQKNGTSTGLSYISDMDINDLISIDNLAAGEGVYSLSLAVYAEGTEDGVVCKNAVKYSVGLSTLVFHYENESSQYTENYEYTLPATVIFEITPKDLTVNLGNLTSAYGEDPFKDYLGKTTTEGLAFGEMLRIYSIFAEKDGVAVDAQYSDVGSYDLNANAKDTYIYPTATSALPIYEGYKNYDITFEGTLKINKRKITVQLYDNEVYYGEDYDYLNIREGAYVGVDGGLATCGEQTETLEITLVDYGFEADVFPNASRLTYPVTNFDCIITKVDGETPGTDNYDIKFTGANLTVNRRPVTITLQSVEDIIYGQDLPMPEYVIKYGEKDGLVGSDKFNPEYLWRESGSNNYYGYAYEPLKGNVGKYGIILYQAFSYFTDADGNEVDNYDIVSESSSNEVTLNITPRPLTIELKDITVEYGLFNSSSAYFTDESIYDLLEITGENKLAFKESFTLAEIQPIKDSDGNRPIMKNVGSYDVELVGLNVLRGDNGTDLIFSTHSNYEFAEDSVLTATVTINAKKIENLNLGTYSFTYGEEEEFREKFTYIAKYPYLAFDETLTLKTFYALDNGGNPISDRLDAGDYTISANQSSAVFSDEYGQTNYEVTFTGTLTVKQREITVVLNALGSVKYGKPLAYATGDGNYRNTPDLVYGEKLEVAVSWSFNGEIIETPKNAGRYDYALDEDNSKIFDEDGNEKSNGIKNYSITCTSKMAVITKYGITLTIYDEEICYGDELQGKSGVFYPIDFSGDDLPYNETVEVAQKYVKVVDGVEVGEVENPTEAGIYKIKYAAHQARNEDGTVSEYVNYSITVDTEGTLTIKPRPITVNTVGLPDVFYGEPVSYPDDLDDYCVVGGDGLVEGEHVAITSVEYYDENGNPVDGVPTATGTYFIVPTGVAIYDDNGNSVSVDNYAITYPVVPDELTTCGTIKIMPILLHLVTVDHTWEYDGKEHSDTGYTLLLIDDAGNITDKEFTLSEEEAKLVKVEESYATIKNAGSVPNEVTYDFSDTNYVIAEPIETGTLTITKREITLITPDCIYMVYDGKTHTPTEDTIVNKIEEHHYLLDYITVQDAGEYEYNTTITDILDEDFVSVKGNYKIEYEHGTLIVKPRPIGLQSDDKEFIYNGEWQYWEGYTQLADEDEADYGLVSGHEIAVTDYTTILTVMQGEVDNDLEYKITDADGNVVTDNYEIKEVNGKLKIKPVEITVALNDRVVTYGNELYPYELNNYDLNNSSGLVKDEQLQVAVKYEDGNGKAVDPVDVGEYTVVLDLSGCYVETAYGENGIGNYTILNAESVTAQLTIIPREITVELDPMTKQYGEAFNGSDAGYQLVSGEIVNDDDIKVSVYCPDGDIDERTAVGEYTLAIEHCTVNGVYNITINDTPNLIHAWNYDITYIESKLTVTKRDIVAVAASAEKEGYYDGTEFSCTEYAGAYSEDYEYGVMPWDDIADVLVYVEGTANSVINAGDWDNEAQFESASTNYNVVRTDVGTLTIKQRPVTITLLEISDQTYGTRLTYPDGTEEPNYGYTEGSLEVVEGEKLIIAVTFYGSDGEEADPKNADDYIYSFYLYGSEVQDSIGGAGIDNYAITCTDEIGATVSKLEVSLTLQAWTSTHYDGEEHGYDGGIDYDFPYYETMELGVDYYSVVGDGETLMDGKPRNAGDYVAKYNESKSTIGGIAPDVNYVINISPDGGIPFTIIPLDITISMDTEEYTYDGTVYDYKDYNDNFSVSERVTGETIVPAVNYYEDAEFSTPATPKNAGTYYVKFVSFTVTGTNDVVENYNLLNPEEWCKLVINRREIQIQAVLNGNDFFSIERYDDLPEEGFEDFTFVEEDLANLTPVYSYGYLGVDGTSEPQEVAKEDVNQTRGTYELYVDFTETEEDGNVLGNYLITENLPATLEVTARRVTVEAVYNGEERQYNGEALEATDFSFNHWHGDNKSELGFYDDFEAEYELLFTKDGEESNDLPVNAGTYSVKIRVTNADESVYLVSDSQTEVTVTISKRVLVATAHYDASEFEGITYNYGLLPTSVTVTDTDENGDIGILDKDVEKGVKIDFVFYNDKLRKEVVYNYAGVDEIRFKIAGDKDKNYQLSTASSGETFTVSPAKIYVTPVGQTADYDEVGKVLSLGAFDYLLWDENGNAIEELYGSDTLRITQSSGENKNQRYIDVGIRGVEIKQGNLEVTHCYDIHYSYEEGSPLPASAFKARLAFNPVVIKYEQTSLNSGNPLMLPYLGKAYDLSVYGVTKSNAGDFINIIDGPFVGDCTLRYTLVTVAEAREYEKWIQIVVFDSYGTNVTALYSFQLQNADQSKIVVYGDYLDFNLDAGCDFSDVTESTLYKGYYVLNSGYTITGFTDENHKYEVLLKDGVLRVIVFTEADGVRTNASKTYSLRVPDELKGSVKLTTISQILASTTIN